MVYNLDVMNSTSLESKMDIKLAEINSLKP
jgi:hypothetical protein